MVQHSGGALGLGMIAGILLTVWSANKGMKALMTALNIVYDEEESRGFIRLNAEMEHQTKKDSTVGHPEPMGRRQAGLLIGR